MKIKTFKIISSSIYLIIALCIMWPIELKYIFGFFFLFWSNNLALSISLKEEIKKENE